MEPLSILVLSLYSAYQIYQKQKSSSSSSSSTGSSSYSYTPPTHTPPKKSTASQPEIKKAPDTRMCQPDIKLSDKNKIKAE